MFQIDNSPDHIYMDLICCNNDNGPNTPAQVLTFSETRDNPILQNCEDYYLSIIRFSIDTPSLPLMMIPALTGQSDPNKSSLSVTLKYQTFEFQQYIQYVPQNQVDSVPAAPLIKQDFSTSYYEIYSYQYFIKLLNKALADCLIGLKALAGNIPSELPPYFDFDPTSEKAILNADKLGYDSALTNPIELYFNTSLFQLFCSFDAFYYGSNNIVNGKNYKFNIYELPNSGNVYTIGNASIPGSTVINYLQEYQEFASLGVLGNPISSIIFTSNTIPISASLTSKPVIFNAPVNLSNQSANAGTTNILTDIIVGLTEGFEYKPNINYTAQIYRLISLQSNQPLNSYDITLSWRDTYGNIHPYFLSPGSRSTMKILFVKKNSEKL